MTPPRVSASSILAKYKRTKGPDVQAIIERLRVKEGFARAREASTTKALGQGLDLASEVSMFRNEFQVAQSGGFVGSWWDFFKLQPMKQQGFIDLGLDKLKGEL